LGTFYHKIFAKLKNVAVKEKGYAKLQVIIALYVTQSEVLQVHFAKKSVKII
jgi:hypothetical protein